MYKFNFFEKNRAVFTNIALFMIFFFVYNISLKEYIFKSDVFIAVFLIVAYVLLLAPNYNKMKDLVKSLTKQDLIILGFSMLIIPGFILIKNGDLINGNFGKPFFALYAQLMIIAFVFVEDVFEKVINWIIIFTMEHVFFTWFFYFFPGLYEKNILGLFPEFTSELTYQFQHRQIAGLTMHYSTNAVYLAIGFIVISALCMNFRSTKKELILCIVTLGALLLTGKRGPLVFAVGAVFITYILVNIKQFKATFIKATKVFTLGMLAILVVSRFIPTITESFSRFFGQKDITNGRLPMYELAMNEFSKNPIFGAGWGQYKYIYEASEIVGTQTYMDAHNVYLQLLSEIGLIGFIVFVGIFLITVFFTIKLALDCDDKKERELLGCSLAIQIFFLMYCITGNPLYDIQVLYPYIVCCSMIYYRKRVIWNE